MSGEKRLSWCTILEIRILIMSSQVRSFLFWGSVFTAGFLLTLGLIGYSLFTFLLFAMAHLLVLLPIIDQNVAVAFAQIWDGLGFVRQFLVVLSSISLVIGFVFLTPISVSLASLLLLATALAVRRTDAFRTYAHLRFQT